MVWTYEQDKLKKQEENYQKLKLRKEKQRQEKLKQIEADYQESRRLTKLAEQNYKPPVINNDYIPEPKPKKRYEIYRKIFIAKHNGLPHYNSEPQGKPIGEDILKVDDLINDYLLNPILSIESNMYVYVPYKIYDTIEKKHILKISENEVEYE